MNVRPVSRSSANPRDAAPEGELILTGVRCGHAAPKRDARTRGVISRRTPNSGRYAPERTLNPSCLASSRGSSAPPPHQPATWAGSRAHRRSAWPTRCCASIACPLIPPTGKGPAIEPPGGSPRRRAAPRCRRLENTGTSITERPARLQITLNSRSIRSSSRERFSSPANCRGKTLGRSVDVPVGQIEQRPALQVVQERAVRRTRLSRISRLAFTTTFG